jgi:two-component system nitrogen regulation sensor histidine kinase GlnL
LVRPQAQKQDVEIQVKPPAEPLPEVSGDRVRLEQVLLNLMINAMEAMPDGGTIELVVSISQQQTPESIRIEIHDTGPGIPENLRKRILDPYFTTKSDGTGMGLAMCDKIIRQHNGSLDFSSSQHGSVFVITLPLESGH